MSEALDKLNQILKEVAGKINEAVGSSIKSGQERYKPTSTTTTIRPKPLREQVRK